MNAPFDPVRFSKVLALEERGADGERAAARDRAEAIARASGLSYEDAKLKAMGTATSSGSEEQAAGWSDFFDGIMRERWRQETPQREEALRKYGSKAAIFAETERERLLREAVAGMSWDMYADSVPRLVSEAVHAAYPMPGSLADAFAEYVSWDDLFAQRRLFNSSYELPPEVYARRDQLERMLNHKVDASLSGVLARVRWAQYLMKNDSSYPRMDVLMDSLEWDVQTLMDGAADLSAGGGKNCQSEAGDYPVRRTSAQKRAAVLDLLTAHPDLSDGEIARRCGVSRQTVSNHRKARAKG